MYKDYKSNSDINPDLRNFASNYTSSDFGGDLSKGDGVDLNKRNLTEKADYMVALPPEIPNIYVNDDRPAYITSAPESFEQARQMMEQYQALNETTQNLGDSIAEFGRRKGEAEEIIEQNNASNDPEYADYCDPPENTDSGEDINSDEYEKFRK
jgi:hypothetical protein